MWEEQGMQNLRWGGVLVVRLSYRLNDTLLVEMEGEWKGVRMREELPQVLKLEHIC